ncbi:phage head morphogenesis protein [Denitromonas halophila]|uniref:Phage head morphogenesis domain-containing protein n=1 Tax=Denitromonas halophila TaxID=1629404 RepID=A0A557QX94_9RHOO|nr:phage minor head protein [Denitromonas halophila]TVO57538.1 hypothetical protein FHP91_07630 [Denitromonas halophila]
MPLALDFAQQPFAEQQTFFRQKLNLPTESWRDIMHGAHDRAFVVAGAAKADLLGDLRQAVDDAISKGTGLGAFRKDFDKVVARHGWDHTGGRAWRSRVIYQTNMLSSYSAGRLVQLRDAARNGMVWMYRHSDSVLHPRPLHVSWNRITRPADDVWWQTHYPPNGWGCKCYVTAVSPERAGRMDARTDTPPDDGLDPTTGGPAGIDEGWAYMPGAGVADDVARMVADKARALAPRDAPLARAHVAEMTGGEPFERWLAEGRDGRWPVAVRGNEVVWLDAAQRGSVSADGWRAVQALLDAGSDRLRLATADGALTIANLAPEA